MILGAVHKGRPHKILKKLTLFPLVCKMSALAQPSLSVWTHHKFRKFRSFLHQKVRTSASEELPCSQNVGTGQTPLYRDCGRLLWTVPK